MCQAMRKQTTFALRCYETLKELCVQCSESATRKAEFIRRDKEFCHFFKEYGENGQSVVDYKAKSQSSVGQSQTVVEQNVPRWMQPN